MSQKRVLVVGRHPAVMEKVTSLLAEVGIAVLPALSDEEAFEQMRSAQPDALLVGGGVESSSRAALIERFRSLWPNRPTIEHLGGPHGLTEHVLQALESSA